MACLRNEALRLPFWLRHNRRLGVSHFLIVDNGSEDGTREALLGERDVSLWSAPGSYRASRFGLDWTDWLLMRYGTGHWTLTLDADELLVFPHWDTQGLSGLGRALEARRLPALGALMLDLCPDGPLGVGDHAAGDDPVRALPLFDPGPYRVRTKPFTEARWTQGGPRDRAFFADRPERAPTLNKIPFARWSRAFVHLNSTHSLLPPRLNRVLPCEGAWDPATAPGPTGVLLHTKFLPDAPRRAVEEKGRGEHFHHPSRLNDYYDAVAARPDLRDQALARLPSGINGSEWRQLEALGLLSRAGWNP